MFFRYAPPATDTQSRTEARQLFATSISAQSSHKIVISQTG